MSGDERAGSTDAALREIASLLREATGETRQWAEQITRHTRLEDDLRLESVEYAAVCALVQQRYGPGVDLAGHLSALDVDGLLALTVGDLLAVIGAAADQPRPAGATSPVGASQPVGASPHAAAAAPAEDPEPTR